MWCDLFLQLNPCWSLEFLMFCGYGCHSGEGTEQVCLYHRRTVQWTGCLVQICNMAWFTTGRIQSQRSYLIRLVSVLLTIYLDTCIVLGIVCCQPVAPTNKWDMLEHGVQHGVQINELYIYAYLGIFIATHVSRFDMYMCMHCMMFWIHRKWLWNV